MRTRGAVLLGVAGLLAGCVYYNAIYNAEHLFDQGERDHWAGRDSAAAERYQEVIQKAADGYRRAPRGQWADEALYLIGRARLRQGKLDAARAALREAATNAADTTMGLDARCYLGATLVASGDAAEGLPLLNEALGRLKRGPVAAEGHLWRARGLLPEGHLDQGWKDLDVAATTYRRLRVAAALERLRWGSHYGVQAQVGHAMAALLAFPEAGSEVDSILTLVSDVSERWGPRDAAELLAPAAAAPWERPLRGKVRLARARYLRAAGDTAAASDDARAVASGIGPTAGEARILLAHWRLATARELSDTREVEALLLPAVRDSAVAVMLSNLRTVVTLSDMGSDRPLAWFAAGEIARDRLGAPYLAARSFLEYADAEPNGPWAPKALLAALDVAPQEGTRAWLRGRLEGYRESPYVRAARGQPAPGIESLDQALAQRLWVLRRSLPRADSTALRGQAAERGVGTGG